MFYLPFFQQLQIYTHYYEKVNNYKFYTEELKHGDDLNDIVEREFNKINVYRRTQMNSIILTFHNYRLYFKGIPVPNLVLGMGREEL